jgi:outer membrane protein OmpA-like peptidoglycan-associated protein
MSHKGTVLSFTIISPREIEVRIPALSVGIKEIKFDAGPGGIVTHLNALEVRDPQPGSSTPSISPEPTSSATTSSLRTATIWGFVAGTTRLDSKGVKNLSTVALRLSSAKEITCVGFTMGPTAMARDIQLSYNRAMTVCKRLAASIPGVKIIKVEGRQDSRTGDRIRRGEIKWRG